MAHEGLRLLNGSSDPFRFLNLIQLGNSPCLPVPLLAFCCVVALTSMLSVRMLVSNRVGMITPTVLSLTSQILTLFYCCWVYLLPLRLRACEVWPTH